MVFLCSHMVINVVGKRQRPVPILVNSQMMSALQVLMDSREACNIQSPYVFAIPGLINSRLSFYTVLQTVGKAAEMRQPNLLTTTRLRKHHATMAQVYTSDSFV